MRVKRRARRAAYRRGPTNGVEWKPFGWYNNRPTVLREIQAQGVGVIERVTFITVESRKCQRTEPNTSAPTTRPTRNE